MNIKVSSYTLELTRQLSLGDQKYSTINGFVIRIIDGDTTGYGEISLLPEWTETHAHCADLLETIPSTCDETIINKISKLPSAPATQFGLSLALADVYSKQQNTSLRRFLNPSMSQNTLAVNATIPNDESASMIQQAQLSVNEGFSCLKIKLGSRSIDTAIDLLNQIQTKLPQSVEFRVDLNERWDDFSHEQIGRFYDHTNVAYLEQPLARDNLEGHQTLHDSDIPIALDESLIENNPHTLIDEIDMDFIILKPMIIGTISDVFQLGKAAKDHSVTPIVSTTYDGGIARIATAQIGAALGLTDACGINTGTVLSSDIIAGTPEIHQGTLTLPQQNGNGISSLKSNYA
ncbi:MAG: mandelate racemase/muconate lactonizing enzyme family protein [Halobacteriaceae archaeon]